MQIPESEPQRFWFLGLQRKFQKFVFLTSPSKFAKINFLLIIFGEKRKQQEIWASFVYDPLSFHS